MNSHLSSLLKIELQKFLAGFKGNKKKVSKTPLFYVFLLIFFFGMLMSAGYTFILTIPFTSLNVDPSPAISMFAGITSLLIFMTTMSQARSIYIGEDYDLLSTLPIRKRDIVASKIISIYVVEFLFSFTLMVPHGIVLLLVTHEVSLFLIAILLAFTLPIVPIALSALLSLLITILTAKFKSANLVFAILYTLVIVAISAMGMIVNNMHKEQAVNSFTSIGNVIKWINPSYYFVELALSTNKLFILLYVGINIVVAILSILLIASTFDRLHEIVSSISMKGKYVRKELKNKSETRLLLSLEFKRLTNSKFYFANTIMGTIMAVLGSAVFLFSFYQAFPTVEDPSALNVMKAMFMPIFLVIVMMIIGLVNPTTASINIEGKNFWLTKTLPIDYKKYIKVKLLFAWILTLPGALIASTIAVIFYHENAIEIVFVYLLPLIYSVLNSLIGLIVAIHYPLLKWNSETEAVKSSKTVTICLFINLGMTTVIAVPLIVLSAILPSYMWIAYLFTLVSLIIPIIPCSVYLNNHFASRVNLIEDL